MFSTFTYYVMYGDLMHADAAIETTLISHGPQCRGSLTLFASGSCGMCLEEVNRKL